MGRIRKPTTSSSPADFNPTLADIFGDVASKHRSCWLHIVAQHYQEKNSITWEEVIVLRKKYRRKSPCFNRTLHHGDRLLRDRSTTECSGWTGNAISCRKEGNKLDTDSFENCIESLWKNLSEEKKESFAYLDSLWFSFYRELPTRLKALSWIKEKDIFLKKYVFVPIVCWGHWSLLILVHLGEDPASEGKTPCMLLLDSLENADPKRLEPEIRKFVQDIFKAEGRTESKKELSKLPLIVPKVPQQRDDEQCGTYVLYFIHLFMQAAPESFCLSKGYPYFMTQSWFKPEDLDSFREKLQKEVPRKTVEAASSTRVSRRRPRGKVEVISVDVDDD